VQQTDIQLRPALEADLWVFERQAFDSESAGIFNWAGYRNFSAIRRRLVEDGLIGPDDGFLIVSVDGEAAGTVAWHKISYGAPAWSCWNIGATLLPEYRGKGFGAICQARLVTYLFDNSPVHRIEAYTDVENVAEQRCLEKLNFVQEGLLRAAQFRQGRWRDIYIYAVVRADFDGVSPPLSKSTT
jgi:RimJ/RimL family protein N-acetyltransferase